MKQQLDITGMHCVGCTMAVEGAIEDLKGVRSAKANYAKQIAEVDYDEKVLALDEIIAAIAEAGYGASQRV